MARLPGVEEALTGLNWWLEAGILLCMILGFGIT